MSDQDNGHASTLRSPTTNDPEAWKAYWKQQGWPWRTEPEIDAERQKYLTERRNITPDIEKGIYPFKDIKLSRADVEWLLVTHENGRGPVDWNDESQRGRKGMDLRGAILNKTNLNLLPLARTVGGLNSYERNIAAHEQRHMAGIQLEGTRLSETHLEGAYLARAHLQNAILELVRLEGADLGGAYLEGATLRGAHLEGAYLRRIKFNDTTNLSHITLYNNKLGAITIVDVSWGGVNLAPIKWSEIDMLGDESQARQEKFDGKVKDHVTHLEEYERAVRANRQLAVALQNQGLYEDAARFAYRAQKLQRIILRHQKKFGQYLFSGFLDLLAGYGYRPGRSVIWYLATIFGFALAYFAIGHLPFFPDAFVFSLTSFHGRGFFPGLGNENSLHNPLVIMAAFEAVVGLLIEISFIATFTQRFFGR